MSSFFHSTIVDAFTFKSLVEILHQCFESGNFMINSTGIDFEEMDTDQSILVQANLREVQMLNYIAPAVNYKCGVHFPRFRALTKGILRKDYLKLQMDTDRSPMSIGLSSKNTTLYYAPLTTLPVMDHSLVPVIGEEHYIMSIPLIEWSKTCLDLSKSEYTEFRVHDSGIHLIGVVDGTCQRQVEFGTVNQEEKKYRQVDVPNMNMKALSKLSTLAPTALIRLYYGSNCIKLVCPINHLGEITIHLMGNGN
jgi:hypothetical protein